MRAVLQRIRRALFIWVMPAAHPVCLFCCEDLTPGHSCLASRFFVLQFEAWLKTDDGRAFVAQMATAARPSPFLNALNSAALPQPETASTPGSQTPGAPE